MSNEAIDWAIKREITRNAPRKLILLLLANRANDAWECWPSVRLLAEESGLSAGQVRDHLQALEEEDGLIKRVCWQREDGGLGANGYLLGEDAQLTPYSFTRRGSGRVRPGGYPSTRTSPTRVRPVKNPQEKPTVKPKDSAAREESRRRSSAKAADEMPMPTLDELCKVAFESRTKRADVYEVQIETIRSRAPKLWRDAREKAVKHYMERDKPELAKNPVEVDLLAYQYAIHLRAPNWPAWLLGPLLPHVEAARTSA